MAAGKLARSRCAESRGNDAAELLGGLCEGIAFVSTALRALEGAQVRSFLLGFSKRLVLSKCQPKVAKRLAVRLERAHEIVGRVASNLEDIGSAGS